MFLVENHHRTLLVAGLFIFVLCMLFIFIIFIAFIPSMDFTDQIRPSAHHSLYYDPEDPHNSIVMLKNIQQMGYLDETYFQDDGNGNQVFKFFPNYFVLNNVEVAHHQKQILHAMLKQKTSPKIMIREFCRLARNYYPDKDRDHKKFEEDFLGNQVEDKVILKWYTDQTFFYQLLNRLLRRGKDSTQIYYSQYFTNALSKAISSVHKKQKQTGQQEVSGRFTCYRGGYFSQKQLDELQKNIGKHIETLGFLSTTIVRSEAFFFITNSLLEIDVLDSPKDEELDNGYALLTWEYSNNPGQEEVLFNVLSSFQIKSVGKFDHYGKSYWHIKLEYGVTYEMMKKYKQDKLSTHKDSAEYQQILAILLWQEQLKKTQTQEQCLKEQDPMDKYIWLMKTKINLCKTIPQLHQLARSSEFILGLQWKTNKMREDKSKKQQYSKEIENLDNLQKVEDKNRQVSRQYHDLGQRSLLIVGLYTNGNNPKALQLIDEWKQQKQILFSFDNFYLAIAEQPWILDFVQQWETIIQLVQVLIKMKMYYQSGDDIKLRKQLEVAQQLRQYFLQEGGRYSLWYERLNSSYIEYSLSLELISYETYLQQKQQILTCRRGRKRKQSNGYEEERNQVWREANRHIQHRSWTQAAKVCAEFRQKVYPGGAQEDGECFQPIIVHLNKTTTIQLETKQLLEACLNLNLPITSGFRQQIQSAWVQCELTQKQQQQKYLEQIQGVLDRQPQQILYLLAQAKQSTLPSTFARTSLFWITHECLIINTCRMMGMYEQANRSMYILKHQVLAGLHPEYYQQLDLGQLEEDREFSTKRSTKMIAG